MRPLRKGTVCEDCLGCNRLELEEFEGVYWCKNKERKDENE